MPTGCVAHFPTGPSSVIIWRSVFAKVVEFSCLLLASFPFAYKKNLGLFTCFIVVFIGFGEQSWVHVVRALCFTASQLGPSVPVWSPAGCGGLPSCVPAGLSLCLAFFLLLLPYRLCRASCLEWLLIYPVSRQRPFRPLHVLLPGDPACPRGLGRSTFSTWCLKIGENSRSGVGPGYPCSGAAEKKLEMESPMLISRPACLGPSKLA